MNSNILGFIDSFRYFVTHSVTREGGAWEGGRTDRRWAPASLPDLPLCFRLRRLRRYGQRIFRPKLFSAEKNFHQKMFQSKKKIGRKIVQPKICRTKTFSTEIFCSVESFSPKNVFQRKAFAANIFSAGMIFGRNFFWPKHFLVENFSA